MPKTAAQPKAAPKAKSKPKTRAELFKLIAEQAELKPIEVRRVFQALRLLAESELGVKGPGLLVIPDLVRLKVVERAARKARDTINPRTGQPMRVEAVPARRAIVAKVAGDLANAV